MPKKRKLTLAARENLENYPRESSSAALVVRSMFAGYFMQQEASTKDVEELVWIH